MAEVTGLLRMSLGRIYISFTMITPSVGCFKAKLSVVYTEPKFDAPLVFV